MPLKRLLTMGGLVAAALLLNGCSASGMSDSWLAQKPEIKAESESGKRLRMLPPPEQKAVVAVYDFTDQTGQHKPSDRFAEFSRAVTQGAAAILNESLTKAGDGSWFRVIERKGLDNLLRERQIIAATREQYGARSTKLPPMLYAGMILEGGIVAYETNMLTGGLGARYLGIGGTSEYRQDIVTVYLRAVNVQNGEILMSTNASKTIFSSALGGSVFKFVAFDEILEIESGFTVNEPPQFAVRQAIESAVYSLVVEGAKRDLWSFKNKNKQRNIISKYNAMLHGDDDADEEKAEEIFTPEPRRQATPLPRPATTTTEDEGLFPSLVDFWGDEEAPAPQLQTPTAPKVAAPQPVIRQPRVPMVDTAPVTVPVAPTPAPIRMVEPDFSTPAMEEPELVEPRFNPAPLQFPVDAEPLQSNGSALERARGLVGDRQGDSRLAVPASNAAGSYKRIGSGDEELFCDSTGCYPFAPDRPAR